MSPPEHQLIVRTVDPTSEITVYDASFNRVGRGVGQYRSTHPDGLYEIRVRTAGTQEEKLISLVRDEMVNIGPVAFISPVPLSQTATGDATHEAAVVRACNEPVSLGVGSGLLIVVRDRLGREPAAGPGSPAAGLSLIGPGGTPLFDLGQLAPVDSSGRSPVAAILLHVNPNVYRLRLSLSDGRARERTLVANLNWTTQCFMVRRPRREQLVADLDQGSLSLSQLGQPFAPDDRLTRLGEAARDALANNRQVTGAVTQALMNEKFEDPMLGLLVGHLLLRDTPKDPILQVVVENLVRLLGSEHPDVQALELATFAADGPNAVTEMPMLRASWDAVVTRTVTQPLLVPPNSPAASASTRVLPSAPWLVWEAANSSTTRQADFKMTALRSYVRRAAKPAPLDALEALSPVSSVALDTEDREELTRSLGVPSSVLDDMLSKLND